MASIFCIVFFIECGGKFKKRSQSTRFLTPVLRDPAMGLSGGAREQGLLTIGCVKIKPLKSDLKGNLIHMGM